MRDPKERAILEAAMATFMRYGYRRTTMADIAKAVGVSRPALYLFFDNKEAIFRAVAELMTCDALDQIRETLPKHRSLSAKLNHAFEIWTIRPYELLSRSPDAADLIEQGHGLAADVLEAGQAKLVELLTQVLREGRSVRKGPSAELTAKVLAASVRGLKASAKSVEELRKLIEGLVALSTRAAA